MKTLTKSLIVAALAASSVSQAAVVTFSGNLTQVATGTTGYSGKFDGSYDTVLNALDLTVSAGAVLTGAAAANPDAIVSGTLTAAGGYSAALTLGAGNVQNSASTIVINVTVGQTTIPVSVPFYVNSQGYAALARGLTADAANPTTPTVYTITLNNASGAALTGTFTAVPEPEVYAGVAALGLAGFALWRRRNA